MDNIYRVQNCDVCGKEIREKYTGNGSSLYSTDFENNHYGMIVFRKEMKNWTLCETCGDKVLKAIDSLKHARSLEEGMHENVCNW